jgi:hypothetical protein
MTKTLVVALALATVLTGSAGAQNPQAIEVGGPSAGDPKRSVESTSRLAADSTKETGGADLRRRTGAAPEGRARSAPKLTIQQKRLFVLGLWAGEKN